MVAGRGVAGTAPRTGDWHWLGRMNLARSAMPRCVICDVLEMLGGEWGGGGPLQYKAAGLLIHTLSKL